jgi:hypothetical protein
MASARHGTEMGRKTGAGLTVDSKAEAIAEVMLQVAQGFFRIPALGQKTGLITSWGGGAFGCMRSALRGPLPCRRSPRCDRPAVNVCSGW